MKFSLLTAAVAATPALAYPGMKSTLGEIRARVAQAVDGQDTPAQDALDSKELIGDLLTLSDSQLTPVAKSIKQLLTGGGTPESDETYPRTVMGYKVPGKGSPACAADTCCIWKHIADDMVAAFRGKSGRCTALARGAVRLGFHDAGAWSKFTGELGGADGSIILAEEEMTRGENNGLQEIVAQTKIWYNSYKKYGIGMADLIQFGANAATVVCPLGPRVRTYVGRRDSSVPAPNGLLPPVTGSADFLIELFQNKTINPHPLTALIGAHTTSQQRFVDPSRAGDPQDSTPGVWDVRFYQETLGTAPARVFKFASDVVLAKDPRISKEFQDFAAPGGQKHWNEDYARAYIRLSLLGVFNINSLTECTKALPPSTTAYIAPDQPLMDKWLSSKDQDKKPGEALRKGDPLGAVVNGVWSWLSSVFA